MIGTEVLAIAIGYLLGSIPSAYIAGRLVKRVDIRQVGGRNMGALNTMREIGTAAGITVLLADMAKGLIAVLIARWLGLPMIFLFIVGFAAVVGHNWPIFIRFKGGRGAATAIGVLFALAPYPVAIGFAIMVIVILVTSNFILGMGVGFIFLPVIMWQFGEPGSLIAYSLALPLFCGFKYIPTFRRVTATASGRKNLIFDRQYKPWQKKKE